MAATNVLARRSRDPCIFRVAPVGKLWALTLLLSVWFVPVIALRLVALQSLLRNDTKQTRLTIPREADSELPIYTVLVPLYREAHMLRGLIQSLLQLDWPAPKLDIKLILEQSDQETVEAAEALHFRQCRNRTRSRASTANQA